MGIIYSAGGGGGGEGSDECTLQLADVPSDKKAITSDSDDDAKNGTLDTSTSVADGDVLDGKNYMNYNATTKHWEKRIGTEPNRGTPTTTLSAGSSYTIQPGHYNGGTVKAKDLASQTSGTAGTGQILNGYTATVNGSKLTGNMPNRGGYGGWGNNHGNDSGNQRMWIRMPGGYYNENAETYLSWADIRSMAGITADKIKKGQSIIGIIGSHEGYVTAPLFVVGNSPNYWPNSQTKGCSGTYSFLSDETMTTDSRPFVSFSFGREKSGNIIGRTNDTFDLTDYNYIKALIDLSASSTKIVGYIGVSTNPSLTSLSFDSSANISVDNANNSGTIIANISSLKGRYYVYFALNATHNSTGSNSCSYTCRTVQLTTV